MVPATVNVREIPYVIQASYYAEMPNLRRDQGQRGAIEMGKVKRGARREEVRTSLRFVNFSLEFRKLFVNFGRIHLEVLHNMQY